MDSTRDRYLEEVLRSVEDGDFRIGYDENGTLVLGLSYPDAPDRIMPVATVHPLTPVMTPTIEIAA